MPIYGIFQKVENKECPAWCQLIQSDLKTDPSREREGATFRAVALHDQGDQKQQTSH